MIKSFLPILLLTSLIAQNSYSFSFNNTVGAAFNTDQVIVNVADNCSNLGITNEDLLTIIQEALDEYWNTVATSKLVLVLGSLITLDNAFYTEKMCTKSGNNCEPNINLIVSSGITISCNENSTDNFTSDSILGITLPNNITGSVLQGSLLLINDRVTNQFQNKSRSQMISIIAHELGHAIGLGHSPIKDSLMYYTLVPVRDRLGFDDIDGVTYLYPKSQPFGCGLIHYVNTKNDEDQNSIILLALVFFLSLLIISLYRKEKPLLVHSSSY
ncbi:MAG: matrixin family metalloprotease [Bacteriovoracaceae bacterium]|jgi:hypothetical protein|nr:matrixin family metalloprotease [Bacteriovoracaceae bacterium]